ncbi:MAG: hypothetical protein IJ572_05815 [Bacilli bacterium]|nr:hypothetical protein [Bacilli bacterium]
MENENIKKAVKEGIIGDTLLGQLEYKMTFEKDANNNYIFKDLERTK